jgi:epoxyqueuosine reductase
MSIKELIGEVFSQLKNQKFDGRIVSIKHLHDVQEAIERRHTQGHFDDEFYKKWLTEFVFNPPEHLPTPRSLIVVAVPQPQLQVTFEWNGRSHPFIIPPNYSYHSDAQVEDILTRALRRENYGVAMATLPKKLLAVRSGLAKYGKNNLSYVPGMGSFHRLTVFYSEVPCPEDIWQDLLMMEECHDCDACLRGCPTDTISSDRFLLHAERCISFFNERAGDFPEWIKPQWHNALVGCLYCQRVCPLNKPFLQWIEDKAEFSEEETALLLEVASPERLSAITIKKIKDIYCWEYINVLGRNLNLLLKKKGQL